MFGNEIGSEEFQIRTNVSDETLAKYKAWYDLLTRWNSRINLVGSSTLNNFWLRHALDSHQLYACLPAETKTIIDMGAGAGFPGIALAILLQENQDASVTLVESNGKKCNFLRTVIRELGLPANVLQQRIEEVTPNKYDVVTARAFAPLPKLLTYAHPFWGEATRGVFPKGESWDADVKAAEVDWDFELRIKPSITDEQAQIILIEDLQTKAGKRQGGETIDQKRA